MKGVKMRKNGRLAIAYLFQSRITELFPLNAAQSTYCIGNGLLLQTIRSATSQGLGSEEEGRFRGIHALSQGVRIPVNERRLELALPVWVLHRDRYCLLFSHRFSLKLQELRAPLSFDSGESRKDRLHRAAEFVALITQVSWMIEASVG
jgi:hypothetical protein